MNTTALFIEILLVGIGSEIWISLAAVHFLNITWTSIVSKVGSIKDFVPLLTVIYVGISYILGWVVHFASETLLDPLFQTRFRSKYFKEQSANFFNIRTEVIQKGSDNTFADIQFDRQLLRIARANVFNFALTSIMLIFYFDRSIVWPYLFCAFSLIICLLSFFQWRNRYHSTFKKFYDIYKVVKQAENVTQ